MRKLIATVVLLASPVFASASGDAPPSPYVAVQPGIEVSARRGAEEGTFEVSATITDTTSGKVIAAPRIILRAGTWAVAAIGSAEQPAETMSFSATVDPTGSVVAFLAHASEAGGDRKTYSGTARVAP